MDVTDTLTARAKINLALHVTGRRADGYHLLDTLVAFAETGDRLEISAAQTDEFFTEGSFGDGLPADQSNLVIRARDTFRGALSARGLATVPVAIRLDKRLPVASGIGGGSADAAAVLDGLNRLHGAPLSWRELAACGLALGADVPMCLAGTPLIARGIGEALQPLEHFPSLFAVLTTPAVAVSTPTVFARLAHRDNAPLPPLPEQLTAAALVDWLGETRNDLQAAALEIAPQIGEAVAGLKGQEALFARMSGSGPTCFGLFATAEAAENAAHAIAEANPRWFVAATAIAGAPAVALG